MDAFSFVFSLYSIILGLALTEVLGGAARTIESRHKVRLGWATGLLAATLVADITLFWRIIWRTRKIMPDTSAALFAGVLISGLYYFAAALVFPHERPEGTSLDSHFMAEKSRVLSCILLANLITYACRISLMGWAGSFAGWQWPAWAEVVAFMGSGAVAIFLRSHRLSIGLISVMLAADLIDPVFAVLRIGA